MLKSSHSSAPIVMAAVSLLLAYRALIGAVGDEAKPHPAGSVSVPEPPGTVDSNDPDEPAGKLADFRELFNHFEAEIAKNPSPAVAVKDFSESERLKILESVLEHLLTSKDMADSREFYGDGGDKTAGLMDSEAFQWPRNLPKQIGEYELIRMSEHDADDLEDRAPFLWIRLDRFLNPNDSWADGIVFDCPILAIVSNYAAADAETIIIGGCFVGFVPALKGKTWTALATGAIDP